MIGKRKHDVFVIGDELSEAETSVLERPTASADDQAPGGHSQPPGLGHPSPWRRRALAALALAGPTGIGLGVLVSSLSTPAAKEDATTSSSRSASVQGPTPRAVAAPASLRPPPDHRPNESDHGAAPTARRPHDHAAKEPEREPTVPEAPESSPLPIAGPPAEVAPPTQPPPSPPPPQSGGGHSGTETFGFER